MYIFSYYLINKLVENTTGVEGRNITSTVTTLVTQWAHGSLTDDNSNVDMGKRKYFKLTLACIFLLQNPQIFGSNLKKLNIRFFNKSL